MTFFRTKSRYLNLTVIGVLLCFATPVGSTLNRSTPISSHPVRSIRDWARSHDFQIGNRFESTALTVEAGLLARGEQWRGYLFSRTWWVQDQQFKTGRLPVTVTELRQQHRPAPLLIFLPGIFAGAESPFGYRAANNLSRRGYHIAVIPNPWSRSYLDQGPKHEPGDLHQTTEVILRAITSILARLNPDSISEIRLMGESYGGFLAAVIASRWNLKFPLTGPIISLGAPLDLSAAAKNIDQMIRDQESDLKCQSSLEKLKTAFSLVTQADRPECAHSLLADGFLSGLKKAAPDSLDLFYDTLSKKFPKTFQDLSGEMGKLSYWIDQAKARKKNSILVVTSQDDFLNRGLSWSAINHSKSAWIEVIQLAWGGHVGFVAYPDFQNFLDLAFGPYPVHLAKRAPTLKYL